MKTTIVFSLVITALLALVTNLVSNFLSNKAKKYKKALWALFIILLVASIGIALVPQELYSSKVEIFGKGVSNIKIDSQNNGKTNVHCVQQLNLVNRGNTTSSIIKYTATLKYMDFMSIADGFSSQSVNFYPGNIDENFGNFNIIAFPFIGDFLSPIPSKIVAQTSLDFDSEVHFTFNANTYDVIDVHSSDISKSNIPLLIQYEFNMADGSKIKSEFIPCAFVQEKPTIKPSRK